MASRLVTQEDLDKYPQLKYKGVSRNQHFDFSQLEAEEKALEENKETEKPKASKKEAAKTDKK